MSVSAEQVTPGVPPAIHHMDAPTAYQSAKFGMWLFLATEVLLFGGLFAAFTIFRWLYLDVFIDACRHLDIALGATNTAVLLTSSLTAALSVDAAQRGNNAAVRKYLLFTILCGFGFLVIKYQEYSYKAGHGIFPGDFHEVLYFGAYLIITCALTAIAFKHFHNRRMGSFYTYLSVILVLTAAYFISNVMIFGGPGHPAAHADTVWGDAAFGNKYKMFYGLYYCMTGLHALHVIMGMGILFWVFLLAKEDRFSGQYYTPVEVGALYWHLVDLIWIYLFPLLYLIGR